MAAALLAAGALTALYLRVWGLGAIGLDATEAATAGEAGSLLGSGALAQLFPSARGEAQLFQLVLGGLFAVFGAHDIVARLLVAAIGVVTALATYAVARSMWGAREATLAALLLALMPYHVIASRAVGPEVLAALWVTLSLAAVARFASTERGPWVTVGAVCLGLALLTDASSIAYVPVFFLFVSHRRWTSISRGTLVGAFAIVGSFGFVLPLAYGLSGQGPLWAGSIVRALLGSGRPWYLQLGEVVPAFGLTVLLGAVGTAVLARRRRTWREVLLGLWIVVPSALLLAWPDRTFADLAGIAPPLAVLAARALAELPRLVGRELAPTTEMAVSAVGLGVLAISTAILLGMAPNIAGSAHVPGIIGGRDTARWIGEHVPPGAALLTTDRAFAGVLEFYAQRETLGLTSSAPLATSDDRPNENPDLLIRQSALQYIVWDTYSAEAFPGEADRLLAYAERYNAREIYRFEGERLTAGERTTFPITIVYEVRP
ncbi:MAG: glycosyltransferase family 39 protein [Dehalococcoidia bacterium]|nr:glycosyltransferase family 39 protein [Dehalococcoidia bacterium]